MGLSFPPATTVAAIQLFSLLVLSSVHLAVCDDTTDNQLWPHLEWKILHYVVEGKSVVFVYRVAYSTLRSARSQSQVYYFTTCISLKTTVHVLALQVRPFDAKFRPIIPKVQLCGFKRMGSQISFLQLSFFLSSFDRKLQHELRYAGKSLFLN